MVCVNDEQRYGVGVGGGNSGVDIGGGDESLG